MINARFAWMALTAALSLAGAALAQISIQAPGSGQTPLTAAAATAPASGPATQSATDIIQGLMNNQAQPGATTMPGSTPLIIPEGPALGADGLLREGQEISQRGGHLERKGDQTLFVFDEKQEPAYPPMVAVPSHRLQAMEDAAGLGEGSIDTSMHFASIIAEVTQYRGKNYLFIKPSGPLPAPAKPVAPPPNKPLVTPVAPNVPAAAPLEQGYIISRRVARLVKDAKTGAELIAFDADGKLMSDPPMGVIPSQYLAVMEDASNFGDKPVKFLVSGEVTTYRGKNYLYLKFVKVVTDIGGGIGSGSNEVTPAPSSSAVGPAAHAGVGS